MIKQLRKASEHLYTRIFIGLMVAAFILWGVNDFKENTMNDDVVKLKYSDNIEIEEFLLRKRENLIKFQQSKDFQGSKEELNKITDLTLDQLINERLVKQIIENSDIDISDETFYGYIQKLATFQNEMGEFDRKKFDKFLLNSSISEQEFISSYKQTILGRLVFDTYINSIYVPKILDNNILNYSLETRIFDVASIDLSNIASFDKYKYTQKDLEEFYNKNREIFKIKEYRDINYMTISYADIIKNFKVEDRDIESYYKENQDDFNGKNLEEAKKEIPSILASKQKSEQLNKFVNLLEDEIASGVTIDEIARKYNFAIHSILNFSDEQNQPPLNDFKNTLMGMEEKELSYPIETKDGLIIFEVKKINQARVAELSEIQKIVEEEFKKDLYRKINLESINSFSRISNKQNFISEAAKHGLKVKTNLSITRKEYANAKDLPESLINEIFSTKSGESTKVSIEKDRAFIAFVKEIKQKVEDQNSIKQILDNIQNRVKISFIDDIILHLNNINQIKINKRFLEREKSE